MSNINCPECGHDIDLHSKGRDGCWADTDTEFGVCGCPMSVSDVVRALLDAADMARAALRAAKGLQ